MVVGKCKTKVIKYEYIQWNWNMGEVVNFCQNNTVNWREKLDGKIIIYGHYSQLNQTVCLGDYIVRDSVGNVKVYTEEEFNKLFDILED